MERKLYFSNSRKIFIVLTSYKIRIRTAKVPVLSNEPNRQVAYKAKRSALSSSKCRHGRAMSSFEWKEFLQNIRGSALLRPRFADAAAHRRNALQSSLF